MNKGTNAFSGQGGFNKSPYGVNTRTANASLNGMYKGDTDADTLINRMTNVHSSETRLVRQFIVQLKRDMGIQNMTDVFDFLYIFAQGQQSNALLNWAQNAFNCSVVGSPTFTPYQGFNSGSNANYLNTNYNPAIAGGRYTQDSASLGAYSRTNTVSTASHFVMGGTTAGAANGSSLALNSTNNNVFFANANSVSAATLKIYSTNGMFSWKRVSATDVERYCNGSTINKITLASSPITSMQIYILVLNNNGSPTSVTPIQVACAFAGSADIDHTLLYKRVQEYMNWVGAAT